MKKWVEKMRQKTEPEKRNFALFTSFLITVIIAVVWAVSFIIGFESKPIIEETVVKEIASPFEAIKSQASLLFDKDKISNLMQTLGEVSEEIEKKEVVSGVNVNVASTTATSTENNTGTSTEINTATSTAESSNNLNSASSSNQEVI